MAAFLALLLAATAVASLGGLTQKPGIAGCVNETGDAGDATCTDGTALEVPNSVDVSSDGKSVYVASTSSDAIAIFDRNATTGALTQKPAPAGCVSDPDSADAGDCSDGVALRNPFSVAVSPDGTSVYAAGAVPSSADPSFTYGAVAILHRNPATGALTSTGCLGELGISGDSACTSTSPGMRSPGSVEVSPDGTSAYVTSTTGDSVAILHRAPSGALTQGDSPGCVSDDGHDGGADSVICTDARSLASPTSVAVSPNGKSAYVTTEDGVAIFTRTASGALTQKLGPAGCITESGAEGCASGRALLDAESAVVSPDGASVYVASSQNSAVAIFDRNTTTGALTQKPGAAGCYSLLDTGGACAESSGTGLARAASITVSPDGASVYVAGPNTATCNPCGAIAIFDRNTATGALTQQAGTAGCISESGSGGTCTDGAGLLHATSIVVSPDDDNAYVAASGGAVAIFDREGGGAPPGDACGDAQKRLDDAKAQSSKAKAKLKKAKAKLKKAKAKLKKAHGRTKVKKAKAKVKKAKVKLKKAKGKAKKAKAEVKRSNAAVTAAC